MRKKVIAAVVAALAAATMVIATAGPSPAGEQTPITVTKVVSGPEPPGASYVINVSCIGSASFADHQADLNFAAGGGSQQFTPLEPGYEGDCTFTETTTSGATPTYACEISQVNQGAGTCGGGGASPSTLNVNDPLTTQLATITVTNTFASAVAPAVEAAPSTLTG